MVLRLSSFSGDVIGALLAGFSTPSSAVVSASDSILAAIGKLQAQVSAAGGAGSTTVNFGTVPIVGASFLVADANITATSAVRAFVLGSSSTGDNSAADHQHAAASWQMSCAPAAGAFTLAVDCLMDLCFGTFVVYYEYENAAPGPSLDLEFLFGPIDPRITYTGSGGTYFNSVGVLTAAATNAARFDYDPVTLAARGLLIEESRTNLLKYSADTSNGAAWFGNNAPTITLGAGAPDGSATLNHWTRTTTIGSYTAQTGAAKAASSLPYALSAYAAAGTNGRYLALSLQGTFPNNTSAVFDLQAGTVGTITNGGAGFVGSATITPIGGGKYRCTLATSGSDTTTQIQAFFSFNSNGTNQIANTDSASNSDGYIWGCQLEQAAFATSYIPTTGATATRAADVATMPTASWFNAAAGTLAVEAMEPSLTAGFAVPFQIDDGSNTNRILIYTQGAAAYEYTSAGTNSQLGVPVAGSVFKAAASFASGSQVGSFNGAAPVAAAVVPFPTGMNQVHIGCDVGTSQFTGYLRRVRYWPQALGTTQLQSITT